MINDNIAARRDNRGNGIGRLIAGLMQLWLSILALILAAAFILSFLGANPDAPFAQWIYARTNTIMRPFDGLFDPVKLNGDSQIQTSLLFAIFVYVVLGAVVNAVQRFFEGR